MKLGFLTACLKAVRLEDLVPWAAAQGFEMLELSAWPVKSKRDYQARHIDVEKLTQEDARRIKELFAQNGMGISSLAFYENNLHPNRTKRRGYHQHLRKVIDAASMLGVDFVGTFVGARPVRPDIVIKEAGTFMRETVKYAEDRGVRIMFENCPMENWVKFGLPGNYAYSPELWDALFNEVPSESFGINLDPSHLLWLGIDYNQVVRDYAARIFHVHAKDTEILKTGRYRYGILSDQLDANPWKSGWWRYRLPGLGEIDWRSFLDTLREVGYDFVVSIEHEDPEYEGSVDRVKLGLQKGVKHLRQCLAGAALEVA